MAMDIPMDAIREVQISLRKEAKMSSYDPDDTPLPNLPSVEETIAEVDPSPPYLRCKHCKARLLRGVQSLVCVFCGREHCKDLPPDPISFRSTLGYRWLLQSLALGGSEIVDLPTEANESNRGQTAPKDELSLSDLLNIEIKWTSKSEQFETGLSNETPAQPKSFLGLAGVNLDNFFSEGKKDAASNTSKGLFELSTQSASQESNAFQGHENLSLFENVQPSEIAVPSTKDKSGIAFEGYEKLSLFENVQPSETAVPYTQGKSGNAFEGHEKLSLFENMQPSETAVPSTEGERSNSLQGHEKLSLFENVQVQPSETAVPSPEGNSGNAFQGHEKLSLFEDVQPSETVVPSTEAENGDSTSGWATSFQSAASEKLPQESKPVGPLVDSTVDLSAHIDTVFGSIGGSTSGKGNQNMTGYASMSSDWFQDDLLGNSNSGVGGAPNQFESLATVQGGGIGENANNSYSFGVDLIQDNQWPTTSNNALDNKTTDEDNDSFDAWNDFTSSNSAQNSSISSSKQSINQMTPVDQNSVVNLFSTASNSENLDFGSFSQLDFSAGAFNSSQGSTVVDITQAEASVLDRMADASAKDERKSENVVEGDVSNAKAGSKSEDVEKIMSQMHDLSFMLESNLSIPPKQDGLHSLSQD